MNQTPPQIRCLYCHKPYTWKRHGESRDHYYVPINQDGSVHRCREREAAEAHERRAELTQAHNCS